MADQPSGARPRVSVAMVTFNHEKYIARAIDGVLMQETELPVEIVVGEDCSTDRTRAIVREYASAYPNVIRPLLPPANLGPQKNFVQVLRACSGEFIAYLEGDDLWTSPAKLATQVAFLESSPDCASCFHNVVMFADDGGSASPDLSLTRPGNRLMCRSTAKPRLSLADFFEGNPVPSCSVVFRRQAIEELPPWFDELPIGDLPLHILCAQHGSVAYLDEVMGAYRQHSSGAWTGSSPSIRLPQEIATYGQLERYFRSLPDTALARQGERLSHRALGRARAKLELARARKLLDATPEQAPAAVLGAWRRHPRRVKWLLWYLALVWPRILGGAATAGIIHRKLRRKF